MASKKIWTRNAGQSYFNYYARNEKGKLLSGGLFFLVFQSQYDNSSSIATRLNQENALREPTIEELLLSTLRILIREYEDNPQSVIAYFHKRNSLDSKDGQR